ncbi:MAG TPA: hypothetical protein VGO22_22380 [Pseudorhizobium sp.]|nr:hypothetical protein [Pseudorhizobium sp.]
MRRRLILTIALVALLPALMSFRLDGRKAEREALLYDVRGAFVAARSEVPPGLIAETDRRVNEAILATRRESLLPRTILTVRLEKLVSPKVLIGERREATVSVEAVAVASGEVIASGSFTLSVYSLRRDGVDHLLAERIAQRISREFRLGSEERLTLATALFPGR